MNQPEQIQTEYTIPTYRVDDFNTRFKRLIKIAKATGNPPPTVAITNVFSKTYTSSLNIFGDERKYTIEYTTLKVDMLDTFKLPDDWKLLGILDHVENMVRTVPEQSIPENYLNSDNYCDHCHSHRSRKETFVVEDKNGNTKQIGRQCLIKYLGFDGDRLFKILEWFSVASEEDYESDVDRYYCDNSIRMPFTVSLNEVIKTTIHWLNNHSWVSGKVAYDNDGLTATSSDIRYIMFPPTDIKGYEIWLKFIDDEIVSITPDLNALLNDKTKAVIDWAKNIDPKGNEYMHNLRQLAVSEETSFKYWGFAVSMVSAYDREMGQVKKFEAKKATWSSNDFIGEVKDRLDFVVKMSSWSRYETDWGTGTCITFETDDGNSLVWFSSSSFVMGKKAEQLLDNNEMNIYMAQDKFFEISRDRGFYFPITATVKSHKEYKGRKQTVLTRVTMTAGDECIQEAILDEVNA